MLTVAVHILTEKLQGEGEHNSPITVPGLTVYTVPQIVTSIAKLKWFVIETTGGGGGALSVRPLKAVNENNNNKAIKTDFFML
jgi:hypothetical protein